MDLDVLNDNPTTEVGSYFIANYPPFSVWSGDHLQAALDVLDAPAPSPDPPPLGLYLHIPFCRKRCKFCYFRVYTDKNSSDVEAYLEAISREAALYAERAVLADREFEFVYFGGGTPSFLSSAQLLRLIDRISEQWDWNKAREVTFECEPGTLRQSKLETIRKIGVTRLSLGVEHFDDEVLALNGRAHKSLEVYRSYGWAREVGFDQINLDLIAGMVGDTEAKWKATVEEVLKLSPDSLTIYQMELPHNTVIARDAKQSGALTPVAGGSTKRAWVDYAFNQFLQAGYELSSAYTVAKPAEPNGFIYRDAVWRGADMLGLGVASFSHIDGVHFQNEDSWDKYIDPLMRGELPLSRAWHSNDHQRLIREMILQLKTGKIDGGYFRRKFGVEITQAFAEGFDSLVDDKFATVQGDDIRLTREGLLRADGLLSRFFETQFRNVRYT